MSLKLQVIDTTLGDAAREIMPGASIYDRVFDMGVQPHYADCDTMEQFNAKVRKPIYLGSMQFTPHTKAGRWPVKVSDDPEIWVIGNNHVRFRVKVV